MSSTFTLTPSMLLLSGKFRLLLSGSALLGAFLPYVSAAASPPTLAASAAPSVPLWLGGCALALLLAWGLLHRCSEAIVTHLFEAHCSAASRRGCYPPGQHDKPTRAIDPPEQLRVVEEAWAYHTLKDGRRLWWLRLLPEGKPRAVVAFFH
ncbi:hypothetical protein T492DRAFT_858035, partial [Pavlovales sp. CCMP2436]